MVRTAAPRRLVLTGGGAWLAACTTEPASPTPAAPAAGAAPEGADTTLAGEPYLVRLVDRSRFDERFRPARLPNTTGAPAGTILVDTAARQLYLVESRAEVLRYGVAVGTAGRAWRGTAIIGRMARWPAWYPTDAMRREAPGIPRRIPPGDDNPLGARALYLHQNGRDTLYRIHGTSEPWLIGTEASSGCVRMFNEDIIALYDRVRIGTRVVVR